jgi:hypothetical protein
MTLWTDFERKTPKNKCICDILVLLETGDLEQELGIFHKNLGTFVMRASDKIPCGTTGRVLYWKEQED